jgi:hypothetical protein
LPGKADKRWVLIREGRQHGPFTDEGLRRLFRGGRLRGTDRLRRVQSASTPDASVNPRHRLWFWSAWSQAHLSAALDRPRLLRQDVAPHLSKLRKVLFTYTTRTRSALGSKLARATTQARAALQIARDRLQRIEPVQIIGVRLPPTQLAIATAAALVACATLAAMLVFPRTALPSRAPSPIAWSFDAGKPLLLTMQDRTGADVVEAVVITGVNRSTQTLQKVEGTLRSERSNLSLQGALQLAENPSPELLVFDVPPNSQFTIRFPLPRSERRQPFVASHGGLTFTFRYSVDGVEQSLFQHIPSRNLEAEISTHR